MIKEEEKRKLLELGWKLKACGRMIGVEDKNVKKREIRKGEKRRIIDGIDIKGLWRKDGCKR